MTAGVHFARWLAVAALSIATAAMFVVSLRGNYLYGYGIGQTDEKRLLFAWANVAADVWKAFGLVAVSMLWRARQWRLALVGSMAWLVCLLSGVNSAIGVYVEDRSALTGVRHTQVANYKDVERELAEIDTKRSALISVRSIGELDALIAAALAQVVFVDDRVRGTVGKISDGCNAPTTRTSEACSEVARLRAERAGAEEKARLQARTDALRYAMQGLREHGSNPTADPVGEFYAWATRGFLSVRDVGFGFPLFFALMIEIVTAFGPITVVRFAELSATPTATTSVNATWRDTSRQIETRRVIGHDEEHLARWMSERARPRPDGRATTLAELHGNYDRWCVARNLPRCDARAFAHAFDRLRDMPELSGKIRKFGTRYYGVSVEGADAQP